MATFRKRGKKWEYRIRYTDPLTGAKKEKSKGGFKTKADAEYAASTDYIDVKDGFINPNKNILFKDYADSWLEIYRGTVKETSLRSRIAFLNILKNEFNQLKLSNLTENIYQKKLNKLSTIYKKNTLLSINQVAQMIAKQAAKDGYFKNNPIAGIKIPHYDLINDDLKYWELVDINNFTNALDEDINKKRKKQQTYIKMEKEREKALFYLLIFSGMRIGEVCALKLTDYYPLTKEINIDKTLGSPLSSQSNDSYKIYPPKTKSSYRQVPIPQRAYLQLEKWIVLREQYKNSYPLLFTENNYLFCKKNGSPLTPRDIRTKFYTIIKKANLPKITLHGLRHTYTSLQIQAGIDPKSLQVFLGHSTIKTTLDIYAHITAEKKQDAIVNFEKLLNENTSGAKAGQSAKSTRNTP